MKQLSRKFNSRSLVPASIDPLGQKCKFFTNPRWWRPMVAAAILDFRKLLIISAWMKQFSPTFNSRHLVPASIDPMGQICKISKIQDGGGRHLEFRKMPITSAWLKQF
jgi:hypothetical protein